MNNNGYVHRSIQHEGATISWHDAESTVHADMWPTYAKILRECADRALDHFEKYFELEDDSADEVAFLWECIEEYSGLCGEELRRIFYVEVEPHEYTFEIKVSLEHTGQNSSGYLESRLTEAIEREFMMKDCPAITHLSINAR